MGTVGYKQLLSSPLSLYSAATAIMAADLEGSPRSGFEVQLYGDAHLGNFAGFTSHDGQPFFDICDYDQTLRGPWEWDVKRLAVGIEIAGRRHGCDRDECRVLVLSAVAAYRQAMHEFAASSFLSVWHARLDLPGIVRRWGSQARSAWLRLLGKHHSISADRPGVLSADLLTERSGGTLRIKGIPSRVIPVEELLSGTERQTAEEAVRELVRTLKRRPQGGSRRLPDDFVYVHMALDLNGGSELSRNSWVILLANEQRDRPLLLQLKEARASGLEPYLGTTRYAQDGERVIAGRRLLQADSHAFLAWGTLEGLSGDWPRSYHIGQLPDCAFLAEVEHLSLRDLLIYGAMCGWTIARGHARSGDRVAIDGYLGTGPVFDRAVAEFSASYADQVERDYHRLRSSVQREAFETGAGG